MPLFIHQVIAQKALVLYEIRRVSIEVQEYRSTVRNEGNDKSFGVILSATNFNCNLIGNVSRKLSMTIVKIRINTT